MRLSDAIVRFNRAVTLDPRNPDILHKRARINGRLYNWPAAATELALVVSLKESDVELLLECAIAHAKSHKLSAAKDYFDRAFAIGDPKNVTDPSVLQECAKIYVALSRWDEAIDHYGRALELEAAKSNWSLRVECANVYAEPGLAKLTKREDRRTKSDKEPDLIRAAVLLQEASELNSILGKSVFFELRLATVRLAGGDIEGYRGTCAKMLKDFGTTNDATTANNVAWACALGPKALANPERAVELAELAVKRSGGSHANYLNTLGAALCRAERFAEAAEALNKSRKAFGKFGAIDEGSLWDKYFTALTIHGIGHPDIARVWLDQATASPNPWSRFPGDTFQEPPGWQHPLQQYILRREVESLLRSPAPK